MARQIRIEFPGAFYHVFSRGNQRQRVFLDDEDRAFFINLLRAAYERFGTIIHVYCLMPNHFHILIETPYGHLSRTMHFLITSYTVCFNKKHDRRGHLFQGRYKSILVEAVVYARGLSRYIHLNPVVKGLVKQPEDYPWSSCGYYLGKAKPERWLATDLILRLFGDDLAKARTAYVSYLREKIGHEESRALMESPKRGILGSEEFIARVKQGWLQKGMGQPDREKPQLRNLRDRPDPHKVLSVCEDVLGPRHKRLVPIAMRISHKNTAWKLKDIAAIFGMSISSVSNAQAKARVAIAGDAALARAVEEIERRLG